MEIANVTSRRYNLTKEEKGAWLDPKNATPFAKATRLAWEKEELDRLIRENKLKVAEHWAMQCADGSSKSPFWGEFIRYKFLEEYGSGSHGLSDKEYTQLEYEYLTECANCLPKWIEANTKKQIY